MNILIFGGTGFIGSHLAEYLFTSGFKISIVTRNEQNAAKFPGTKFNMIHWDISSPLSSVPGLQDNYNAVINLAGESIANHRWTNSVKTKIKESRVNTTKAIVTAIKNSSLKTELLINGSAVGYYGFHNDEILSENSFCGDDFLAQVCRDCENEAYKADKVARVVTLRTGIVLGNGGMLKRMTLPYKFYLGGTPGNGNQWISWIHVMDLTRIIKFIIDYKELRGPINATAPNPLQMSNFCEALGQVLERPSWLPLPGILLKIVFGQMSEMLLNGQRVMPDKVLECGFEFKFPCLKSAIANILR